MASSANVQAIANRKLAFKTPVDLCIVDESITVEKTSFRNGHVFAVFQVRLNAAVDHEPVAGVDVAG